MRKQTNLYGEKAPQIISVGLVQEIVSTTLKEKEARLWFGTKLNRIGGKTKKEEN